LTSGAVSLDHVVPDGRNLLSLNRVKSSGTGAGWLVFGEYFHNPDRSEVRIWRRGFQDDAQWEVAATFPAGQINHIHSIQQLSDGRIYVLAGDFDEAAGIWITNGDLGELKPWMRGKQELRACWWYEYDGNVLYGTDSQFEINKLMELRPDDRFASSVHDLPGSCIYHGRTGMDLIFSTTVEPGTSTGSFVHDLLSRAVGPAITGNPTIFHYSDKLVEVFSAPKDVWPLRLAQFGTFMFPGGVTPDDRIYAYGVAVKGYDGDCLVFKKRQVQAQ
jgi:hypothetical protein